MENKSEPEVKPPVSEPAATSVTKTVTSTVSPVQEKKKGVSKVLIVLGILLVLCILCSVGLIFGAKLFADNAAKFGTDLGNKVTNEIGNQVNSKISDTIQSAGSNLLVPQNSGAALPDGFPTDIPLFPGYKVISASTENNSQKPSTSVVLSVPNTPDEVKTFYKTELPLNGWKFTESSFLIVTSYTATKLGSNLDINLTGSSDSKNPSTLITLNYTLK